MLMGNWVDAHAIGLVNQRVRLQSISVYLVILIILMISVMGYVWAERNTVQCKIKSSERVHQAHNNRLNHLKQQLILAEKASYLCRQLQAFKSHHLCLETLLQHTTQGVSSWLSLGQWSWANGTLTVDGVAKSMFTLKQGLERIATALKVGPIQPRSLRYYPEQHYWGFAITLQPFCVLSTTQWLKD